MVFFKRVWNSALLLLRLFKSDKKVLSLDSNKDPRNKLPSVDSTEARALKSYIQKRKRFPTKYSTYQGIHFYKMLKTCSEDVIELITELGYEPKADWFVKRKVPLSCESGLKTGKCPLIRKQPKIKANSCETSKVREIGASYFAPLFSYIRKRGRVPSKTTLILGVKLYPLYLELISELLKSDNNLLDANKCGFYKKNNSIHWKKSLIVMPTEIIKENEPILEPLNKSTICKNRVDQKYNKEGAPNWEISSVLISKDESLRLSATENNASRLDAPEELDTRGPSEINGDFVVNNEEEYKLQETQKSESDNDNETSDLKKVVDFIHLENKIESGKLFHINELRKLRDENKYESFIYRNQRDGYRENKFQDEIYEIIPLSKYHPNERLWAGRIISCYSEFVLTNGSIKNLTPESKSVVENIYALKKKFLTKDSNQVREFLESIEEKMLQRRIVA